MATYSSSRQALIAGTWQAGVILDLVIPRPRAPYTTESVDDYLKAILELGGSEEERVSSNALAHHLGVRAASVNGMLQKLAAKMPPIVNNEKIHGVRLTHAGIMLSLQH